MQFIKVTASKGFQSEITNQWVYSTFPFKGLIEFIKFNIYYTIDNVWELLLFEEAYSLVQCRGTNGENLLKTQTKEQVQRLSG